MPNRASSANVVEECDADPIAIHAHCGVAAVFVREPRLRGTFHLESAVIGHMLQKWMLEKIASIHANPRLEDLVKICAALNG